MKTISYIIEMEEQLNLVATCFVFNNGDVANVSW